MPYNPLEMVLDTQQETCSSVDSYGFLQTISQAHVLV